MYTAILILPLICAIIAGLFGRAIGHKASEYITSSLLVLAAILSWVAFVSVALSSDGQAVKVELFQWITSGQLDVSWGIRVDTLTAVSYTHLTLPTKA